MRRRRRTRVVTRIHVDGWHALLLRVVEWRRQRGPEFPSALGSYNRWTHIAGVYTPGRGEELFVDGRLVAAVDGGPPKIFDAPVNALIGGRSYGYWWTGELDDVRIYDRALSAEQIAALAER